jgi:hypothetical protein
MDELPSSTVAGLRLLFIDMILEGADPSNGPAAIAVVMTVLKRILDTGARSAVPVIWSKHPEVVAGFKEAWRKQYPYLEHLPVIAFADKIEMSQNPSLLRQKLVQLLEQIGHLGLLWGWEELVHEAAADTTQELSKLVVANNGDWFSGLTNLLGALAHAEGGNAADSPTGAVRAVFRALDQIFEDRLEVAAITHTISKSSQAASEQLATAAQNAEQQLSQDARAGLNRLLLVELVSKGDKEPLPGNIYIASGWNSGTFPIGNDAAISPRHVVEAVCKTEADNPKRTEQMIADCVAGLVEITPSCDIAQGSAVYSRLLTCLFVPLSLSDKADKKGLTVRSGAANKNLGRLALVKSPPADIDGVYRLVVTAIPVWGIAMENLGKCQPAYRLRTQAVIEVQTWFAAHALRPGMTNFPEDH